MSTPAKMGVVVTQPTDFIERNPSTVAFTRNRMTRDIVDSGRLPDQASWKREDVPREMYDLAPMTRFTLDAVSEAHVIVLIHTEGRYTDTTVHEVQIGTTQQAQERADALNVEHGHVDKFDPRDGEWWGDHFEIQTVSLGYPESDIKVTQEFRAQTTADRQREMRLASEWMRR